MAPELVNKAMKFSQPSRSDILRSKDLGSMGPTSFHRIRLDKFRLRQVIAKNSLLTRQRLIQMVACINPEVLRKKIFSIF